MAPPQSQWLGFEEKPHVLADGNHSSAAVQVRGAGPGCPQPPGGQRGQTAQSAFTVERRWGCRRLSVLASVVTREEA